jgi:anti-sigma B factor antagonist
MSAQSLDLGFESSANGVTRLILAGELDIANAHEVHKVLRQATIAADCVVVDLSGLTFIDSTGVRLLLQFRTISERDGWRLRLVSGPPQVQNVFRILGLEDRLPFLDGAGGAVVASAGAATGVSAATG